MADVSRIKVRRGAPPARVSFVRGARMTNVDVSRLFVTTMRGARVVSLSDLWVASQLPGDLFDLSFDFIGDDGFRSTDRSRPRLGVELFSKGFLDLATRDLMWDDGVEVPWFYRVKAVRTIIADDASIELPAPPPALACGSR